MSSMVSETDRLVADAESEVRATPRFELIGRRRLPEHLRLTYEDYCLLPADGRRHEIIGGEHVVSPAPRSRHQLTVTELFRVLLPLVDRDTERLLTAPLDVVLGAHDIVQPDLVWLSSERSERLTELNLQGAPDLVVEILSLSSRRADEKLKRGLYERSGVHEYWIVDPELLTVRIFERGDDGAFAPPREIDAERGERLRSALFATLDVEVAVLFD